MRTLLPPLLMVVFFFTQPLSAQKVEWVALAPVARGESQPRSITIDDAGYIYSTGRFINTVDFDPGPDTFNLTSATPAWFDAFVQKLDPQGNLVWVVAVGGTGRDAGEDIVVDAAGNVYVIGTFLDTADFDPGPGVFTLMPDNDIFVLKLNAGGQLVWVRGFGSAQSFSYDSGNAIAVDAAGSVYFTGSFMGIVDFDPGAGTVNLNSNGYENVFVCKLNAAGNYVWATEFGSSSSDEGQAIKTDAFGNIYIAADISGTVDVDPGPANYPLTHGGSIIVKWDSAANFIWATEITDGNTAVRTGYTPKCIALDSQANLYVTGDFTGQSIDFDPGLGSFRMTAVSAGTPQDIFIQKFNTNGGFLWAKSFSSSISTIGKSVACDRENNVYLACRSNGVLDADPSTNAFPLSTLNYATSVIKLTAAGNFQWAYMVDERGKSFAEYLAVDHIGNVYTTGEYYDTTDFDMGPAVLPAYSSGDKGAFVHKVKQAGVTGFVFNDYNADCVLNIAETGIPRRKMLIQPGDIGLLTNQAGLWFTDSLPVGTYTVSVVESGPWKAMCPMPQQFTVTNPNAVTLAPSLSLFNTQPCAIPQISVVVPVLRPCFQNQHVYVKACNTDGSTGVLSAAYADVKLDPALIPTSATLPYTVLGNQMYRFNLGNITPMECIDFSIACSLSCTMPAGRTVCVQADIYPADTCAFDTIPAAPTGEVSLCNTPWDKSSLQVRSYCANDSIYFIVSNTGGRFGNPGDMDCFTPIRVYVDGYYILLDSVMLASGDSAVFVFSGDGRTWRLEAEQHPRHPGNSHPSATIEACGNNANWTSGLVTILPQNNADPASDIFCQITTGSFDPNDKTGYPLGVGSTHAVYPNGQMEYLVRFQNTGTDTAFTVVVRDTLDNDFDIGTVTPGVASHPYIFNMLAPRLLEWRFYNILLPDSNRNEPGSHGFATFSVNQKPGLPNGTKLENKVGIYFDYNAPVITNNTQHTVDDMLQTPGGRDTINITSCGAYTVNSYTYSNAGTYFQTFTKPAAPDSIVQINLVIDAGNPNSNSDTTLAATACDSYMLNGKTYTHSGLFTQSLVNARGCDSSIYLNLAVHYGARVTLTESACYSYTFNNSIYTQSGTYTQVIPLSSGCDSTLTLNLTVYDSTTSVIKDVFCAPVTVNGEIYTSSGSYTQTLPNAAGCDSIINLQLTIRDDGYIAQTGDTLVAGTAGSAYQWLTCAGDTVPGATGASFIPTANGEYALAIERDSCIDLTDCYYFTGTGIATKQHPQLFIYTQRTQLNITISNTLTGSPYYITDLHGKTLLAGTLHQPHTAINIEHLANGVYLFVSGNFRKDFVVVR